MYSCFIKARLNKIKKNLYEPNNRYVFEKIKRFLSSFRVFKIGNKTLD